LKKSLQPRNSELVSLEQNLVDVVWAQEKPARPKSKVFPLDTKYSGESSQDKISRLREELTKKKVKAMVVNMLDEVAWLFNLRGADIDFNPGWFSEPTKGY
jgi:Xaa-Pro aminopeptidase